MDYDPGKLDAFIGKMIGHMTGAALCYSIWILLMASEGWAGAVLT